MAMAFFAAAAVARATDAGYVFEREPRRYALVVGNSTYDHQDALPSANEDVRRVADILKRLNFEVTEKSRFPSVRSFEDEVLPEFRKQIEPGDLVVFYFSGHGFAYGQNNFIAPADLPRSVRTQDVTRAAIAIENLEDYFARRSPGLILIIIDACRTITGFVINDGGNQNFVAKGTVEAMRRANDTNALFALASKLGTSAIGTSEEGKSSIFTESLNAHIARKGIDFGLLFKDVGTDVAIVTQDAQRPGMVDWSYSNLYLAPSADTLAQEKEAWLAALDSNTRASIERFVRRFSTSRFASAARKWLADHPADVRTASFTAVSPLAVERVWNAAKDNEGRRAILVSADFGLSRLSDSATTDRVASLDDEALGLVPSGTRSGDPVLQQRILSLYLAHGTAVTTKALIARAGPYSSAPIVSHVPLGTPLEVKSLERFDGRDWFAASLPGQANVVFLPASGNRQMIQPLELGRDLREVLVPRRSDAIPDLVDPAKITATVADLKSEGRTVTWVSIATGPASPDDPREELARDGELVHARYVLKRSGIDGRRITAVAAADDVPGNFVRVRFFGY
jgi:hypothetical protein